MGITARRVHYTYEQYLTLENASPIRHEYLDGEIYAMAGGTPDHAGLAAAVIGRLRNQLPAGYRVFTSDLRVRVAESGLSTYPDAAVVCHATVRASDDRLAVTNPVLLVEVTSASTEDYDRGEKLRHYMHLPSLQEVLIVSHREPRLTLHRRGSSGWTEIEARSGGHIDLTSVPAKLPVDLVYRDPLEDAGAP
jgi:Uma2 family endonuclease